MMHSTLIPHLHVEGQLLWALYQRAKHQHRTQSFLVKMLEVHRLTLHLVASLRVSELPKFQQTQKLVVKLQTAVTSASLLSYQIVQLRHFLALHTVLLGIYARLATLAGHATQMCIASTEITRRNTHLDERFELAPQSDTVTNGITIDKVVQTSKNMDTAAIGPDRSPNDQAPRERPSILDASRKKKKRKTDAIDDLFAMY